LGFNAYFEVPLGLEEHWVFKVSGDKEAWSDGIWTSGDKAEYAWSSSMQEILESGLHAKILTSSMVIMELREVLCVPDLHCALDTTKINSLFCKPWPFCIRSFSKNLLEL
jgi:hypothetical protein